MAVVLALREPQLKGSGRDVPRRRASVCPSRRSQLMATWWIQECDREGSGEGDKIGDPLPMRFVDTAHRSR